MLKRLVPILVLTAVCWLVFGVNNLLLGGRLEAEFYCSAPAGAGQ